MVSEVGGEWEWELRVIWSKDVHVADRAIFGSVMVWHHVLKLFCSTYICIYNKSTLIYLFLFNTLSTCKCFQVPTSTQEPMNFDPWLWVTQWLKPAWIQVWHFEFQIPMGMDPGHPQVHLCSALTDIPLVFTSPFTMSFVWLSSPQFMWELYLQQVMSQAVLSLLHSVSIWAYLCSSELIWVIWVICAYPSFWWGIICTYLRFQ